MDRHRRDRHPRSGPSCRGATKKGGQEAQALGRSRGGFGTKIHAVVDALGLPVRFKLGPGQQNDMAPAQELIDGLKAEQVLADKAYDADSFCGKIPQLPARVAIPPRRHPKLPGGYEFIAL
uniref:Transposase, IS4 n=1 Tax=Magnetospirillum gryphiswaldense TaxID=55518 RepID=A4U3J3_9PROT|nr:transposase, IS4 [Magnetospirillum gryphiswaldense MSR-1]